jgi:hypothetical protein
MIVLTCQRALVQYNERSFSTMMVDMDKGRHPKVVRTWMAEKIRKAASKLRPPVVPHKPESHNKT